MYVTGLGLFAIILVVGIIAIVLSIYFYERFYRREIYVVEEYIDSDERNPNAEGFYSSYDKAFQAMKDRMLEVATEEEVEALNLTKGDGEWDEFVIPETEDYCACKYIIYSTELDWKVE